MEIDILKVMEIDILKVMETIFLKRPLHWELRKIKKLSKNGWHIKSNKL